MNRFLALYLIAFAVSLALTPVCREVARRLGFVAKPREDRWHKKPTAMFGGVAIALTAVAFGFFVSPNMQLWQLLGAGFVIAAFGLADDILSLKPSTKLIVQISLASALVFFGYRLHWTSSMLGDSMLTLFWVVGITNGFNLLDNMDGLCAGTSIIAGLFLLLGMAPHPELAPAAGYLAALLGATSGFLVFNFHPASIFMGDTGSLFLGFNLAALTLVAGSTPVATGTSRLVSVVAGPVLLLLIPIFDTTLVTVMRLLSGRRPSQGGRDHSSHRLVAIGLREPTAVAVLWALAACGGGIALAFRLENQPLTWVVAAMFAIAMVIFAVYLGRVRVYADKQPADADSGRFTPLLVEFMHKRRVAEVLLDLCLIPVAYYSAYHLRFGEAKDFFLNYGYFLQSLPIVVACQLIAFFVVGAYRGTWRFFGIMDAVVFGKGVALGTVSSIVVIVFSFHFDQYSRSVWIIYSALLMLLVSGSRSSFRLVGEFAVRRQSSGDRCIIYGTTGASVATIREAFGQRPMKIVGFVDDDAMKANERVAGYSVLGDASRLLALIEAGEVDCVVVNSRIADVERLQHIESACRTHDVELVNIQLNLKPFHVAS